MRKLLVSALAVYWTALLIGTHLPARSLPHVGGSDKLYHWLGYCGLAGLLAAVLGGRRAAVRSMLGTLCVVALYGAVDEWTQRFVPGRSSDWRDWYADVIGGGCGVVIYLLAARLAAWRHGTWSLSSGEAPPQAT